MEFIIQNLSIDLGLSMLLILFIMWLLKNVPTYKNFDHNKCTNLHYLLLKRSRIITVDIYMHFYVLKVV
jgi:hypothetical protein